MRIEVIANHSVEENIFDEFRMEGVVKYYTKTNNVQGIGTSGPRMGDAIWPEENFILVVWCDEQEALGIERALNRVKQRFPAEGIKLFGLHEVSSNTALLTGKSTPLISFNPANSTDNFKKQDAEDAVLTQADSGTAQNEQTSSIKLSDGLGLKI
ncbi:MAG: hypothetical protein LBV52_07145 [Spirochaetaceae bacterium]|jgi:hypothetical protein|nr:hypothetical protein [Spirochaetaceae bacterium]